MRRRRARLLICAAAVAALSGCGNERTPPPDVTNPAPPQGFKPAFFPEQGMEFAVPSNWRLTAGPAPLVASLGSGRATIAVWRYARTEKLPVTAGELERARRALLAAVRARDRTLRVRRSRIFELRDVPAVQIVADQTIRGERRRVRSTHLYDRGAEIVVDAFAPPSGFREADRAVFRPLLTSLRLRKPRRAQASGGQG